MILRGWTEQAAHIIYREMRDPTVFSQPHASDLRPTGDTARADSTQMDAPSLRTAPVTTTRDCPLVMSNTWTSLQES